MGAPVTIVLDGTPYSVPPFNLGQRRKMSQQAVSGALGGLAFDILALALERADPRPLKLDDLEPTQDELDAAFTAIAKQNGFPMKGEAKAPAEAAPGPEPEMTAGDTSTAS